MKKNTDLLYKILLTLILCICPVIIFSQVTLDADGPGNTYELINSVLAPGNEAVENPECIHPEFGRHIAEVWDTDLNKYVFEFYIHVTPDNDRCINFDRQRVEIKTYEPSPDNLKGTTGETVTYKWKFRLPVGFQPSGSFTHLHQIKAVGGDADMPIFTLTARKGSTNKLELIYNNTDKETNANLSLFEGKWVEVIETIKIDNVHGSYSIVIRDVITGDVILSYSNSDLMTIRADNDFIRPKWGIYRSLLDSPNLRDEAVRFAGFSIQEGVLNTSIIDELKINNDFKVISNPGSKKANIEYILTESSNVTLNICSLNGQTVQSLMNNEHQEKGKSVKQVDLSGLAAGLYLACLNSGGSTKTARFLVRK